MENTTPQNQSNTTLSNVKPGDTVVLNVFRRTQGYADKELTIEVELIESVETVAPVQNNYAKDSSSTQNPYSNFGNYFGLN